MNTMDEDKTNTFPGGCAYVMAKAKLYLKMGADAYRRKDFFHKPDAEFNAEDLENIAACFRQLVEGKGCQKDKPIENVGIRGIYVAINTLHFEVVGQAAYRDQMQNGQYAYVDEMICEHLVSKKRLKLFNKVVSDST